jgi:ABC-2 type transport system ATP-binding protein
MLTLEVAGLSKRYRGVAVVDDVNFSMTSGDITGYLGPNGSGKSTTVKMLTGLVEPSGGHILLNGNDVRRDIIGFKRLVGYVPEEAFVYPTLTAMEYLELMGRLRGMNEAVIKEKSESLLKLFDLYPRRHSPLAAYSKGMRQRVLISSALLHDPEILIFDEPLSGLDVGSAMLFKHLITELAARGRIILYISHVLEVVEKVCSKVIVIYKGKIKAEDNVGRLRELMQVPSLEEIFTQLVQQQDMEGLARDIVETISRS